MSTDNPSVASDATDYKCVTRTCRYCQVPLIRHSPDDGDDGYCLGSFRRIAGDQLSVNRGTSLLPLYVWRCEVCGYIELSHAWEPPSEQDQ